MRRLRCSGQERILRSLAKYMERDFKHPLPGNLRIVSVMTERKPSGDFRVNIELDDHDWPVP